MLFILKYINCSCSNLILYEQKLKSYKIINMIDNDLKKQKKTLRI